MKNLLNLFFLLVVVVSYGFAPTHSKFSSNTGDTTLIQESKTVKGVYNGYDRDYYYFTLSNGQKFSFHFLKQGVRKQFDVDDKNLIGKTFEITYESVKKIKEEGETGKKTTSEIHTVVGLALVQ